MTEFLNNPSVVIAIVSLIVALTNWVNSLARDRDVSRLNQLAAKHEEQLNGGFEPRVKAVVNPVVTGAVNRLVNPTSSTTTDVHIAHTATEPAVQTDSDIPQVK